MRHLTLKTILPILIIMVFGLFFAVTAKAATVQIASPWAASTINAAINNAASGDTIELIGTGTVTWTTTINIPNTKGITLLVQNGTGGSWASDHLSKTGSNFPITVTSTQNPAIRIVCGSNKPVTRISGFKFQGGSSGDYISVEGLGRGSDTNGAYRIDNNYFGSISASSAISIDSSDGEMTGLTDNNTFYDLNDDNYTIRIRELWKGGNATCWGYDSWQREFLYGGNRFQFIEDNLFRAATQYNRHYVSSDGAGGRFVIRHNTFYSSRTPTRGWDAPDYIDAHGDGCQGLGSGARGGEIYANTFAGTDSTVGRDMNLRGGWWLIYDNSFTTLGYGSSAINFTEYRASASDCYQVQYPSLCYGTAYLQCETVGDYATKHPLPEQIQHTFTWNNIYNSTNQVPYVENDGAVRTYIASGTDYFPSANILDAKSKGLDANYASYAYPHPLRGGSVDTTPPAAPTGLVVI